MKDKEKQIEEMTRIICQQQYFNTHCVERCSLNGCCPECTDLATDLYNLGYRKHPEDSVVLSREEFGQLLNNAIRVDLEFLEQEKEKTRKETAEKFLNMIYWKAVKHIKGKNKDECFIEISFEKLEKIAKNFGVEIKE